MPRRPGRASPLRGASPGQAGAEKNLRPRVGGRRSVDNPSAGHSLSARNAWPAGTRVRSSGLRFVLLGPAFPPRRAVARSGPFVLAYSGGTAAAFHRLPFPGSVFSCPPHHTPVRRRVKAISNRKGRKVRKGRPNQGNDQEQTKQRTFGLYPNPRFPLRAWRPLDFARGRPLRLRHASTYGNRRLWITFWREFWGVFLGGFSEPTGPGASVRGLFSAEGVPWVRWASANLQLFAVFCRVFGPF